MNVVLALERALAIFPTFYFLVMFLIMGAVHYQRYHSEKSDQLAMRSYRDFIVLVNSQASILSVINGLILVILYNSLVTGIVMALITQVLTVYVFVSLYMGSNYDAVFFTAFTVLAFVFDLILFLFSDGSYILFGRGVSGVEMSLFIFIFVIIAISAILAAVSFRLSRIGSAEDF